MAAWLTFYEAKSDYMSAGDIDPDTGDRTLTIAEVRQGSVEGDSGRQRRGLLVWREDVRPMVLNKTNSLLLHAIWPDSEQAIGSQVTVWWDPTVTISGETVGGLRVKGAPGLRPCTVTIKLPKRRDAKVRLVNTARQSPASLDLDEVMRRHGIDRMQLAEYLASIDRPLPDAPTQEQRTRLAAWLDQNHAKVRALPVPGVE